MAAKPLKSRTVAVKIESEVADFLARLPNKSEFIRQAILAQFGMACPLCNGSGQVSRGIGAHYTPVLEKTRFCACHHCRSIEPIPRDLSGVPEPDRPRWEQFLHGGPFFCSKCFGKALACGECGWHMDPEYLQVHFREEHTK